MSNLSRMMHTARAVLDEQERAAAPKAQPPFFVRTTWLFAELAELALPHEDEAFKAITIARLGGDIAQVGRLVDQIHANTEPLAAGQKRHERRQLCGWIKDQITEGAEVMNETITTKRNGYSLEHDLQPIIDGKVALPNAKPVDRDVGAAILHYQQMHSGQALMPDGKKKWNVRFFLDYGQGGGLHGSGIVAWVDWKDGAYRAVAMKFAICVHALVEGAGANHSRGWHPASCSKCGLDMSVDSGD